MNGKFAFAVDTAVAHSGRCSARLECTGPGPATVDGKARKTAWARWYQTGLKVDPARTYRLRVWVRTSTRFTATVAVWVTGTRQRTMSAKAANTAGRWVEVVIDGVRPQADKLGLYLNVMDGVGAAWFDDVELVERN